MAHPPVLLRQYGNGYGGRGDARPEAGFRRRLAACRQRGDRIQLLFMLAFLSSVLILKRQYNSFQNAAPQHLSRKSLALRMKSAQISKREKATIIGSAKRIDDGLPEHQADNTSTTSDFMGASAKYRNTTHTWLSIPPPNEEDDEANSASLASPLVTDLWTNIKKNATIPTNIWFTYKHDIFETKEPAHFYHNVQKTSHIYTNAFTKHNESSTISSDNIRVTCMDNNYCRRLIESVYPDLVQYFDTEPEGSYKGDICRLAALYLHGGYYFDVDIEVIRPFVIAPSNSDAGSNSDQARDT
jgi:hypothetical protein